MDGIGDICENFARWSCLPPNVCSHFDPSGEEEVSNLITDITSSTSNNSGLPVINLSKLLYTLANDITARAAFAERCKDTEAFLQILQKTSELVGSFGLVDVFPSNKLLELLSGRTSELESVHLELDRILENIISDHTQRAKSKTVMENTGKHEAANDILNILLDLRDNSDPEYPLTTDNVKAVILDLFGGADTTSTTILWAMSELMKNPQIMEKVQAEVRQVFDGKGSCYETDLYKLEYFKLVIKETMRLHPPFPLLVPRECREMFMINGDEIPVGIKVIVNAWAIGRDPNQWTEPESFYPGRFLGSSIDYKGANFELIPFGVGRRICPGISFGMANIELPLAQLLYHFNWKLPNGRKKDLDMTEGFGQGLRRKTDLCLIPSPYHAVPIA